jgi:hypothetical protein
MGIQTPNGFSLDNSGKRVVVDPCACRKLNPTITVMQSADHLSGHNAPDSINRSRDWRVLVQREVSPSVIIIVGV